MKKVILLFVMVLAFTTINAQFSIKDFTLGEKYYGEVTADTNRGVVNTTLGGIEGQLLCDVLQDKRIASIYFVPTKRVYPSQLRSIVKGLESKFNITIPTSDCNNGADKCYSYIGDGQYIFINVDTNEYMTPPTEMAIILGSDSLDVIKKKEEQQKANTDF
jgi:hypothetical protein